MGTLYVVATPIGNLKDLSFRAIETLKNCDLILVEDTRQTIKLLNHYDIKNKMVSYHKFNEREKCEKILEELKNGKDIALVSDAGTPCISDPGYILIQRLRQENINILVVPGCSAVISALSVGGLDTSSFGFYGFVPTVKNLRDELFEDIKNSSLKTKVVYESPKRIIKFLEELALKIPNCNVCICSELTKVHEKYFYGKIVDVLKNMKENDNTEKGEYVILISNDHEENLKETFSLEAMIVDDMIKNRCSLKEAIKNVNGNNKNISKKEIYNASLNLKEIFKS